MSRLGRVLIKNDKTHPITPAKSVRTVGIVFSFLLYKGSLADTVGANKLLFLLKYLSIKIENAIRGIPKGKKIVARPGDKIPNSIKKLPKISANAFMIRIRNITESYYKVMYLNIVSSTIIKYCSEQPACYKERSK